MSTTFNSRAFRQAVLRWFQQYGRKHLPWQENPDAYRVWLSEIMLQQTQVNTVIPYFQRFVTHFPTVFALAQADEEQVLQLWSGLGYYARARHLHKTAQMIVKEFQGIFPRDLATLQQLPGIGRSTAAAILALAMQQRAAILDGNVKRVFARLFLLSPWQQLTELWDWAEKLAPRQHIAAYTQALMDLGALICTRTQPKCAICPLQRFCLAWQHNQQAVFPGTRPKKALPVRHTQFLLIRDTRRYVWLEKRPARGIWGGLWSLPEYTGKRTARDYCCRQLGYAVIKTQKLPAFTHTFTHFRLEIQPIVVNVRATQTKSNLPPGQWVKPEEWQQRGLPAPVRKLLAQET